MVAYAGYELVFHDEFAAGLGAWSDRLWYQNPPPDNAVYVENSTLVLECRRVDDYTHVAATSVSLDAMSGRSWTSGYFEAKLKWTPGAAAWPAFWLFDLAHSQGGTELVSEIDIFEGDGASPEDIMAVLHYNTSGYYGVPDQTHYTIFDTGIDLSEDWHIYSVSWEPDAVTWYLDETEIFTCPSYSTTGNPKYLVFSSQAWPASIVAETPDVLKVEVDWVKVWQKRPRAGSSSIARQVRAIP